MNYFSKQHHLTVILEGMSGECNLTIRRDWEEARLEFVTWLVLVENAGTCSQVFQSRSIVNNKFVVGSEGCCCSESDVKIPTFWPLMVHVRSGAGRPGELLQDTFNIEPCWYSDCIPDSIGGSEGLSATIQVIVKDRYLVSNICFVKILVIPV